MGRDSKIEWTTHTFNPWIGCTKVSPGCAHCYAEARMDHRFGQVKWGQGQERKRTSTANWKLPVRWNREAEGAAGRPRVFCASLADVFDPDVPTAWRAELLTLIDDTPNLDWLLLTKRPELVRDLLIESSNGNMVDFRHMPNVWLGTTVEDARRGAERIPHLVAIEARVRFLSCEPMLEHIGLDVLCFNGADSFGAMPGIHWVIAGGESGPGARPMHPDWARSLRDQCAKARVPFLFKQWGEWSPEGRNVRGDGSAITRDAAVLHGGDWYLPDGTVLNRVGKLAAGRHLDGILHDGYPCAS